MVKVKPWEGQAACIERFVWLCCYGVPLNGWSNSSFKAIGELWGTFISTDEPTLRLTLFAEAKMLVTTSEFKEIDEWINIEIEDKWYRVKVLEEPCDQPSVAEKLIPMAVPDYKKNDFSSHFFPGIHQKPQFSFNRTPVLPYKLYCTSQVNDVISLLIELELFLRSHYFFDQKIGLLNVDGYNSLLALFDNGVEEGFIKPSARHIILFASTAKVKMEVKGLLTNEYVARNDSVLALPDRIEDIPYQIGSKTYQMGLQLHPNKPVAGQVQLLVQKSRMIQSPLMEEDEDDELDEHVVDTDEGNEMDDEKHLAEIDAKFDKVNRTNKKGPYSSIFFKEARKMLNMAPILGIEVKGGT
ncbi:hypothetical protein RHMOL_Rhmol04G0345400 [Rhododendron molle]|uniref:Uncharacterized protein n=1 Tax=Rhododendron molle TaxID=49168 RepID=A0ACC0P9W0_RHOML|nr:hypothetical protein RHMOL_Rhmol04G0345400 [Rhododendron molle]